MEAIYLLESIPEQVYILQEIVSQLERLIDLQNGANHWVLALAAMNIGFMVMLLFAIVWRR